MGRIPTVPATNDRIIPDTRDAVLLNPKPTEGRGGTRPCSPWPRLRQGTVVLSLCLVLLYVTAREAEAEIYHVDSGAGDDANPGISEKTPWKTVDRVNRQRLRAGDAVLFKRAGEWLDVSINVDSPDLTLGAYGAGAPPRLLGSTKVANWKLRSDGVYQSYFPRPANRREWTEWEVKLVMDAGNRFYRRVESLDQLTGPGQFYYNKGNQYLYLRPFDASFSGTESLYVGRQDNIVEIKHAHIDRLVVRDLEISLANKYGVGVWWQGDQQTQGTVLVEGNTFVGNAYSAVCLSGSMNYERITVRNNTIRRSGAEGIYIGKYATRTALEIAGNSIGDPEDPSFGWAGAGPTSAFNGDGIDVKKGNHGAVITRNTIRHLTLGGCGICSHSSALIYDNSIADVTIPGAFPDMPAGIFLDIDDLYRVTAVRHNRILMSDGYGITVRGNLDLHPPLIVEDNDIVLKPDSRYSQIFIQIMNSHNVKILGNRCKGGSYGMVFPAPYPAVDYLVRGNSFLNTSRGVFYFGQPGLDDLKGLQVQSNKVCSKAPSYIEWQSGARIKSLRAAGQALGPKSFLETDCR